MKRFLVRGGILLTAGIVLGVAAHGQVPQGGNRYNPFTGGNTQQPAVNPWTGAGAPGQRANPFTGAPGASAPNLNPYTGTPMAGAGAYNSLTGTYQKGPVQMPTSPQVYRWPRGKFPITGKAGPGLESIDRVVQTIMTRHGIPGAALAMAKDGKLVYARGFGWADLTAALAVDPLTRFGLASLSKPITALAILWLIEHGMLGLDDRAFDILRDIEPPRGARVDPRLKKITIRQLLNHSGGWNRDRSGDPANWEARIANQLGVPMPVRDEQFISFMMGMPLDFEPGTEVHYSNVGYILLGRIVAKVSGRSYEEFVQEKVLAPAGVRGAFLSEGKRAYKNAEARNYLAGTSVLLPPMDLPMVRGAGGWTASAVDMVRFLTALDGSRGKALINEKTFKVMLAPPPPPLKPRPNGSHNGLGWPTVAITPQGFAYIHDGNFHGMRTFMKRSDRGVNWALLFNVSMQPDQADLRVIRQAIQEVRREVEGLGSYPDIDLFGSFP